MRTKIKNISALIVGAVIVSLISTLPVNAQELTGDEIILKEDEIRAGSEIMVSEMTIVHKSGSKRVREIKYWTKGDDSTFVRFLSPANIKGSGFLSIDDNDWLYLPALRKIRRIATKEKGGSFMGSDFSYDDIGNMSLVDDYNARLLDVEEYEEHNCYMLELIPKNPEDISYSKLRRWVDKVNFYPMKTEYYDKHDDLLKIMYLSEHEKIEGIWVIKRMEMQNVQKGSKTIIVNKDVQLNPEIPDRIFTTRQLEKK